MYGAGERSRTPDIFITSEALYQLSYAGVMLGQADIILLNHLSRCNLRAGDGVDLQPGLIPAQPGHQLRIHAILR